MTLFRRADPVYPRVTMHLDSRIAAAEGIDLEGLLVSSGRDHYELALPQIVQVGDPITLDQAQRVEIPRERVLFIEVHR